MSNFAKAAAGFVLGALWGIFVANGILVENKETAVRAALHDVTMDGYNLYLGCLKEDCRAELIGQRAVVQVAARNLCKRGVIEKCILEKNDD